MRTHPAAVVAGVRGNRYPGGLPRGGYRTVVAGGRGCYFLQVDNVVSGVRLTDRISVVGGGTTGLGISHDLDPNVYLLSGGDDLALIDSGSGLGEAQIWDNVRSLGHDPARIRHIFLTHGHADHGGGA